MNNIHNRFESSIEFAESLKSSGDSVEQIVAKLNKRMSDAGGFGKALDRDVRRVVRHVTGVELQPGQGHGTIRADGSVCYRG